MIKNNLATKTYLITGGAGFIGSHLSDALLAQGNRVLAIDNLSTGNIQNIDHIGGHKNFHFARANIEDGIVLDRLASESDVIIHLAAAVGVKLIVEKPVKTIETNVNGTEAVLQAALRYNCNVLIASTSEVYGKGSKIPFSEDDDVLLGPTSKSRWAYAASKMINEFLGMAYFREYNLPVTIFRLFNTVGPRQTGRYGMVVPRFIKQALENKPITVYGTGTQSRCFCHISDVVPAILKLTSCKESYGKVFNIGSKEETTIMALAEIVKTEIGSNSQINTIPYDVAYAPGFEDMQRRLPDISRIFNLTGWKPSKTLDEIIHEIAKFEQECSLKSKIVSSTS